MFSKIMVPVDLAHADRLPKTLDTARDLAAHYGAELVYVGVSAATPGAVAHNPAEFARKLEAFAKAEADKTSGVTASAHAMTSHDPTTDLDPTLLRAIKETGADLVVMASHVPNVADHVWASNAGTIASHADVSVMVVRG